MKHEEIRTSHDEPQMYVVYYYDSKTSVWDTSIMSLEEIRDLHPNDIKQIWDLGKERKLVTSLI